MTQWGAKPAVACVWFLLSPHSQGSKKGRLSLDIDMIPTIFGSQLFWKMLIKISCLPVTIMYPGTIVIP